MFSHQFENKWFIYLVVLFAANDRKKKVSISETSVNQVSNIETNVWAMWRFPIRGQIFSIYEYEHLWYAICEYSCAVVNECLPSHWRPAKNGASNFFKFFGRPKQVNSIYRLFFSIYLRENDNHFMCWNCGQWTRRMAYEVIKSIHCSHPSAPHSSHSTTEKASSAFTCQ